MSSKKQSTDVFQASLLNLIKHASDTGIQNLFHHKRTELYRFIICAFIKEQLSSCHASRSELQEQSLDENQTLRFHQNSCVEEQKLKNEWISLLNPNTTTTNTSTISDTQITQLQPKKESEPPLIEHDSCKEKQKEEEEKEEAIDYKSIGKNCWIYITQNYFTQKDKVMILPHLNRYFNELSSDCLVWKELSLTSYEINTNIPYYATSFELFLSNKCTTLCSIDFECLAKDRICWDIIWKVLSKYCLTLKNIHIGLYDGVWKFAYNQLSPICNELFYSIQKHVVATTDTEPQTMYLPIQRIECAPGVMPNHIVSLLNSAQYLQHFFVPLIYNDTDLRWDSNAFWNIPASLPSTLKSFRGFDAQTPLTFVHECIKNLPNIEEFHVVLYFGSAHPDFIACSYTAETLRHLAQNCKQLQSFEGYFHSTSEILEGLELMMESCHALKLVGLLFHPNVDENDIDALINNISQSVICKRYNPKFQRLTENPNEHVTLRVLEINIEALKVENKHQENAVVEDKSIERITNDNDSYGGNISSQHLKSLDEIDFSDQNEDDYLMNNDDLSEIGLDEKPLIRRNSNNHNQNNENNINVSDSNEDNISNISTSNITDTGDTT